MAVEREQGEPSEAKVFNKTKELLSVLEDTFNTHRQVTPDARMATNSTIRDIRELASTGKETFNKYYKGWTSGELSSLANTMEKRLADLEQQGKGESEQRSTDEAQYIEDLESQSPRPTAEQIVARAAEYTEDDWGSMLLEDEQPYIQMYANHQTHRPEFVPVGWTEEDAARLLELVEVNKLKQGL